MTKLEKDLTVLEAQAPAEIAAAVDETALETLRVKFLGRKGVLPAILDVLKSVPKEDRPRLGKLANEVKTLIESAFADKKAALEAASVLSSQSSHSGQASALDLTLPGRQLPLGKLHPLTQLTDRIVKIFRRMGFALADGPIIETEYYNFEALNTPADHPARDLQDTFYLETSGRLLRTHTSPVQIRVMEKQRPPVRIIAPGRAFRRDNPDATHSPDFHQVEGLYVDRNVPVSDLKGSIDIFFRQLVGPEVQTRFRPHYFPFTEPSFEVDLTSPEFRKKGKACPESAAADRREWLEIAGCGMVHPNVLRNVGYDPEEFSGWAFGFGVERIAMVLYGINDIRLFYENDLRFINQF